MRKIIIGKRGFISRELLNYFSSDRNIEFISPNETLKIPKKYSGELILTSFPRKWFKADEYDCSVEISICNRIDKDLAKITYLSTSKVYADGVNIGENDHVSPQSIYAKNKLVAESFLTANVKKVRILRATNIFSSNGGADNSFFSQIRKNYMTDNIFKFDVSYDSLRDFLPVEYLANFLIDMEFKSGIFNFSSGKGISIIEIVNTLMSSNNISSNRVKVEFGKKNKSQILSNNRLLKAYNMSSISKEEILNEVKRIKLK